LKVKLFQRSFGQRRIKHFDLRKIIFDR